MTPQGKKAFFWAVNKHPNPRNASEKFVALAIVQDHRRGAHIVTSPDGIHWSCANAPFWQTPNDVSGKGRRLPHAHDLRPGEAEMGDLSPQSFPNSANA